MAYSWCAPDEPSVLGDLKMTHGSQLEMCMTMDPEQIHSSPTSVISHLKMQFQTLLSVQQEIFNRS
jgi:hypothetical protein